jgi:hypothetical protein
MRNDIDFILQKRSEWMSTHNRAPRKIIMPKIVWDRIETYLMDLNYGASNTLNGSLMGMGVHATQSDNEEEINFE